MLVDPDISDVVLVEVEDEDEERPTPKPTPNAIPKIPKINKVDTAIDTATQMYLDLFKKYL